MLGRGWFASLGRSTDWWSDLKLQQWSWRWYNSFLAITLAGEFSFCDQTTAPGYCTCQGNLRWRALKAGDGSYWPGNLIFAGGVNWILLFTLAGESHFCRCIVNWILLFTLAEESHLRWCRKQNLTPYTCRGINFQIFYFNWQGLFVTKCDKSLLFLWKSENSLLFLW